MTLTIIIVALASLLAGFVIALTIRRGPKKAEWDAHEDRLMRRFDAVLEAVTSSRAEARSAIQEKISDLYERVEAQNRDARKEIREMLEQFRNTLESYRSSLSNDLASNRQENRESLAGFSKALNDQFSALQAATEQKLSEIRAEVERKMNETLQSAGQTFKDVTDRLAELHVTNQRIVQFSQDIHELQNILKAPRLRGEIGELEMERMLRDCLAPDQFATQHEIDGNRVDAVILNPAGKLPVDSKFPLDAWRRMHSAGLTDAERDAARREFIRAVRGHVDTIAQKYIRPPQTLEFAVMYVPAEGVYYELMEIPELAEHARRARVFPASPITFWALLQVVVIGFKGMRISENARQIERLLGALKNDLGRFREAFERASKQLGHAKSNMDEAAQQLDRFDIKLSAIHAGSQNGTERALSGSSGERIA